MVGELLDGRYRIVREIASGGMSVVYEAVHVKIGRAVAIKVLHRDMAGDPEVVARFLNEARAVGTFGHPNIVASTDFGELAGHVPYLVLEYLEGRTLSGELGSDGPLPVRRVGRIAMQIASALDAAHTRGVIHRDLTSANIFLTKSEGNPDHVKVLDFGISKFLTANDASPKTRRGLTMGTPEFMAPEQISDPQDVDARVDVYALGVIMYHMLAGHPPFHDLPLQSLLTQIVIEPAPAIERGGIPDGLRAIAMRALAKNRDDRFANMREMGAALARVNSLVFPISDGPDFIETPGPDDVHGVPIPSPAVESETSLRSGGVPRMPGRSGETVQTHAPVERRLLGVSLGLLAAVSVALVAVIVTRTRHVETAAAAPIEAPVAAVVAPPPPPEAPPAPARVDVRIESPAPDAKVTMRGRTSRLPLRESVKPGSQPEVIEVTAPKRRGKRFWITLDQTIALSTRLARGRGIADATKQETSLALGRALVEARDAVAEVDHGAHRHASAASHAATKVASAGAPAAAAKPAPPAPEHATPTDPTAEPKPAPPPPAPAKSEQAASKAETVAAAPKPNAAPTGLDPVKTQAAVRSHLGEIQRCYERGKMDYPELKGRVTMRIAVSATGSVTSANVEASTLANSAVESCIAGAIARWKFPVPTGGPAIISYPFNLH
jgi:serine/threonine-protein kinase